MSCRVKHLDKETGVIYVYESVSLWDKEKQQPRSKQVCIGKISTGGKQTFMAAWMEKILEDDFLCYDITSISSYSELNEYIRFGHNRDLEKLPQLNLAMLFGQKSRVPVYYHRIPGNITDVQTMHSLLETFKKLEIKSLHYILETVDGRLFVQFIALILMSALREAMRAAKLMKKYTVRELLLEMDPLTRIRHDGKYGTILTEVTKPQREILTLLNIDLPRSA
jgi:transposase